MSFAYRISAWNRRRKWKLFLEKMKPTATMSVLDVGFNAEEYSETDNFLEKNYPYPARITALGIDRATEFKKRYPQVSVVEYPGGQFPFPTQSFDVVWSNAVIEHVGDHKKQLIFLQELHRVGKHGFITTPNRHFPIEVHTRTPFLHWLPKSVFYKYLRLVGKAWATENYMNLLSEKDLCTLLAEADIQEYRIIKNKLCGFTLDFVVIW